MVIRLRRFLLLLAAALLVSTTGCGTFVARRMAQAPNTYPTWFAPKARVVLQMSNKLLTNFPPHFAQVGSPPVRLFYRVIEPADYGFGSSVTNWVARGKPHFEFGFRAELPGRPNLWTAAPRGTVVLLHGYGLAQFAMAPWAVRLAEDGWRCVLVDLRGHGKSNGRQIYFGVQEAHDLSQLLDRLASDGQLAGPVTAVGESYGAALALRWKGEDPRVRAVVAIAPYAELSDAVMNIGHEYAVWMPEALLKAGLGKLPSLLRLPADELDTESVLTRNPVVALFVAGEDDRITPVGDVKKLRALAAPGSEIIVVPRASHEAVTYFFNDLAKPVTAWLDGHSIPQTATVLH